MDTILFALSLCLKVFTLYFALVAVFALKRRAHRPRTAPGIRFAVIAAARNEEAVIGNLVRSVLEQDYPSELRDVYVVPNNCTDRTGDAALAAGAQLLLCQGRVSGKGDALRQAFAQLMDRGYDAFVVLDADNTLSPDYLARMNDAFAAGAMLCKSRTKAANPTASGVAGCYGLYNTCFDLIWNRPRAACGLSAKLIGTGFALRREVLEALGGWNTATIAEDAEFASQCAQAGFRVEWVPEAVNYDEEPTSFLTSLRQRKRWCSGIMQVARRRLAPLWRDKCPSAMLRWDMTMFLLAPFAQALSGLLLLAGILAGLGEALFTAKPLLESLLPIAAPAVLYLVGSSILAAALCLLGGYGLRGMAGAIVVFPFFMASWLPLEVVSLFKDTTTWQAVAHRGVRNKPGTAVRAP